MTTRKPIFLDYETRSDVPIKLGAYRYVETDAFSILLAGVSAWDDVLDDYAPASCEPVDEAVEGLLEQLRAGGTIIAHNAAFERIVTSRHLRGRPDLTGTSVVDYGPGSYLPPEGWVDTAAMAARRGLPRSLSALAKALGASPKDEAGGALIRRFSCPRPRVGGFVAPEDDPQRWEEFKRYCAQDVDTLREVYHLMTAGARGAGVEHWADPQWESEHLYHLDQAIADRGLPIDVEQARLCVEAGEAVREADLSEMRRITGLDNPGSVTQLLGWLREQGVHMSSLRRADVERVIEQLEAKGKGAEPAARALRLRLSTALIAGRKHQAALDTLVADRVRGVLRYHGAHTGRWAGSGFQPQNLPREAPTIIDPDAIKVDEELGVPVEPHYVRAHSRTRGRVERGEDVTSTDIKALVRSDISGPLIVVDYTAIEGRVLAWLAGEEWALEAYRGGRDIYVETAAKAGLSSRQEGKVATLALGYGGGVGALRAFAGDSLGDDEALQRIVTAWRAASPATVRFWRRLEDQAKRRIGRYSADGPDTHLNLPSGRRMVYRGTRVEQRPARWDPDQTIEELTYIDPVSQQRLGTYGGRLTENLVQATARDILAQAMLELDDAGYQIVGHVHDEVIIEPLPREGAWCDAEGWPTDLGQRRLDEVREIMETVPPWAQGLPLAAHGDIVTRYRK